MTSSATHAHERDAATTPDRTKVPEPRRRIFLPQSLRERIACALWGLARALLFRPTPVSASRWRVWILRCFGADIHPSAMIHPSVLIDFPWNLTARENVIIEHGVIINCMGRISIDEATRISQYAHLCAGTHDYRDRHMPIVRKPIELGKSVWIAADAFVGPGVSVGDGSLLAARSSAFSNLPAGQICVGEPAKPRKKRFGESPADLDHDNHSDGEPAA